MISNSLNILFEEFFLGNLALNPLQATLYGFHIWDDKYINPYTDLFISQKKKHINDYLIKISSYNAKTDKDIINIEAFNYYCKIELQLLNYSLHCIIIDYQQNPFSQLFNVIKYSYLYYFNENSIEKRLKEFNKSIPSFIKLLEEGIENQIIIPKKTIILFINELENIIEYFKEIKNTKLQNILIKKLQPNIYSTLIYLKESYLPKCKINIGLINTQNGKELYELLLYKYTNKNKSELLNIAEENINILLSKLSKLNNNKQEINFDFDKIYNKINKQIEDKILPQYFNKKKNIVPFILKKTNSETKYILPEILGSRPGIIEISNKETKNNSYYNILTLLTPGLHYQYGLFMNNKNPLFRIDSFPLSTNGWHLFCSNLGYYNNNQLIYKIRKDLLYTSFIKLDLGIHLNNWTYNKSFLYLKDITSSWLNNREIHSYIQKIISKPGYYLSFKIGELNINNLEKKCDSKKFYIKFLQNSMYPCFIYNKYFHKIFN